MIKEMSFWKWLGLLVASFVLATFLYAFASVTDLIKNPWIHAGAVLVVAALMIYLYAAFVKMFEGHKAKDLPFKKLASHTGLGLGIGFVYFVLVTGIMALLGCYKFEGMGSDYTAVVHYFFMFLIVAIGEEIIFRGVVFRWIDEKWGFTIALVASALIFGGVHWSNPGGNWWSSLAIAIEAGLLLGAAYKWSGTLWLPIGIHWAWNFSQGNIFGFAVSGQDAGSSVLIATPQGSPWITGGAFGPEASVISVVLGVAASVWFIWRVVRR